MRLNATKRIPTREVKEQCKKLLNYKDQVTTDAAAVDVDNDGTDDNSDNDGDDDGTDDDEADY